MTGNSLDGADALVCEVGEDGRINDLAGHSIEMPADLRSGLLAVREAIQESNGNVSLAEQKLAETSQAGDQFNEILSSYHQFVVRSVQEVQVRNRDLPSLDLFGFHGQTCAHCPPSITDGEPYTVQLGDGQKLADLLETTVVYDFRSDAIMNGSEGAPLAPLHHVHIARQLGLTPIVFCNGGNSGNLTVIGSSTPGAVQVVSYDTGPCNHFPDLLMRREGDTSFDRDGALGSTGVVHEGLLRELFKRSAITDRGENFLDRQPPRSSDPQWYAALPELFGTAEIDGSKISFVDRLRTAEYFAAYVFFHALHFVPSDLPIPAKFALAGGGWKNRIVRDHLEDLLRGDFTQHPVLPEHRDLFHAISGRIRRSGHLDCRTATDFGIDATFMEARIFADAAVSRVKGEPFTLPETTGAKSPTILGLLRFPGGDSNRASQSVQDQIKKHTSMNLTVDDPSRFDSRWSRAAAGWSR